MKRTLLGVAAAILLSACSGPRSTTSTGLARSEASARIDDALSAEAHAHAIWGVSIVDLTNGTTLYERNADRLLIPASNAKLYSTAAALEVLGPDFVFETVVSSPGIVANDTLHGPLVITGSGDPTIGGRFRDGDELAIFRQWADELRTHGIRHIDGDIIGDDNFFDDTPLGYGWSWDDEPYWYSAELGALSFNDNCIDVTVFASTPGHPASITWRPFNTSYVTVENESVTVAADSLADEDYARSRATNHIRVRSRIVADEEQQESLSISNPTAYFVRVLREVLIREGITVSGQAVDIDDIDVPRPSSSTELLRHRSRPLSDIVSVVNKRSQNLYADQLLKVIGTRLPADETDAPGGSAENGIALASRVWATAGVDTSLAQIVDGSGLSRYNLATPRMTTHLLSWMWSRPPAIRDAFVDSLPVGGVDGTLAGRYDVGAARGEVRAKTGTVSNVSTLSGYVETDDGTPLAFSIMANNFVVDTDEIRDVQDLIVTTLATIHSR